MSKEHLPACCAPSRGETAAAPLPLAEPAPRPSAAPAVTGGMVPLPGGPFLMGGTDGEGFPADGEGPVREVRLRPFRIDVHAVSNARFAEFAADTGHVTEAERYGWSHVFAGFLPGALRRDSPRVAETPWWCAVRGADWRHPEGPGSTVEERWDHPVVHVSWNDAAAYARWAGLRLPTEAEWEYAARGGLSRRRYPWGDELTPGGRHMCNIWQGAFPTKNTAEDGHRGTAPVGSFPPNGYGLHNVSGNVWEWCADRFSATFHIDGPRDNPAGPPDGPARVLRGGSYLCHDSYCTRYRVAARMGNTGDSSSGHTGFRCAADA
ncbi:serine/threonine protein phosphatase [Spongiactinospora gelatinilytica]|uniref:Serine/threonine protein phosphatase n=2 Tax=Spongiactinospora gelatinilytica TaxID=2666298 RepID=A0A2W2FRF3_9ACTN|nr:serine/threonine protein phosphatase [Spongiactinospora gelatinilytica]